MDRISSLNGLLPRTTEHYQIDSTVGLNGAYYQFRVKSAHGDYEVESIKNVLKVCHEITAIEGYKANDEGGEVWKGLSGSVKNLGSGAKTIVTKPNQARKAIGRSLSKTGRWVGRLFKRDRDEKSSTGEDRDQAAGGCRDRVQTRHLSDELAVVHEAPLVMAGVLGVQDDVAVDHE